MHYTELLNNGKDIVINGAGMHCKNLRVVLTFYGYLSCTFYKHPVSDWDVPFTMAT